MNICGPSGDSHGIWKIMIWNLRRIKGTEHELTNEMKTSKINT